MKASVFTSRLAPAMSVEEYGDLVKAEYEANAKAQQEATSNGEGDNSVRRYKQLLASGEEDDEQLVDEVLLHAQCTRFSIFNVS